MIDYAIAREEMDRRHMSMSEVARRSLCHRTTVSSILNGQSALLATIEAILDAVGCELIVVKKEEQHG